MHRAATIPVSICHDLEIDALARRPSIALHILLLIDGHLHVFGNLEFFLLS